MSVEPMPQAVFADLCDLAREQNEWSPPEYHAPPASGSGADPSGAPGWDFNHRGTWEDTGLFDAGWVWSRRQDGDKGTVRRPGKDLGTSGTVGLITSQKNGWPLFWSFSTSAADFDHEQTYTKFAVFAILRHRGDYSAAARDLRARGYGERTERSQRSEPRFGDMPEPEGGPDQEDDVAGIDDLKRAGAEVKWVWPNWIQRGVLTAVAAQGGTGKTRLTADLVRRVRHRTDWPDGQPMLIEPGRAVVLWVVSDNHHDEMVSLCEAFGIADCVKLNAAKADPYGGVTLETTEEFLALEARVKKVKPTFVVVDTVGNATDRNLSRQEDAKAFYQPLQLIARRQNVAVLCLTHLNAGGKVLGRRALEKVRVCLRMSARTINDTACKRRLEVIKSNSPYPTALGVSMGDHGNTYDDDPPPPPEEEDSPAAGREGGDKPNTKVQECMDWLAALLESKPYRVSDIRKVGENKGYSAKVLYKAMHTMGLEEFEMQGYKWWRFASSNNND
ncbi:MAG TPA: AAA family ATPase [Gemmataceae bacterium]|nr:AAA family ATPase [Gemmataceae bacterium]